MTFKTPIAAMAGEDWPLLVQQEDFWASELSEEVYEVMRKKITEPRGRGRLGRESTACRKLIVPELFLRFDHVESLLGHSKA